MKTITNSGHSQLIEWTDDTGKLRRGVLPVGETGTALAIPHGLPFAEILAPHVCEGMAERIEERLHQVGIWTSDDLRNKPEAALGAVQAAYGVDLAILLQLARNYGG